MDENELKQYFDILEIEPTESLDAIKQAYKEMIKVWHPDRFAHDPSMQQKATEKMKKINNAYTILCNYLEEQAKVARDREEAERQQSKDNSHSSAYSDELKRYFNILGIEPTDSLKQIYFVYKDLLKVWNPNNFANDPELRQKAQEKIASFKVAYDYLYQYFNSKSDEDIEADEETEEPNNSNDNNGYQSSNRDKTKQSVLPNIFWSRVGARIIDYTLVLICYICLGTIQCLIYPDINLLIDYLISFILYLSVFILYDAFALSEYGTTIGKRLFKIKVTNANGKYLSNEEARERAFQVWLNSLCGMFLGIYLYWINKDIKKNGIASWDKKKGFLVTQGEMTSVRKVTLSVISVILLFVNMIVFLLNKELNKKDLDRYMNNSTMQQSTTAQQPIASDYSNIKIDKSTIVPLDQPTSVVPPRPDRTISLSAGAYYNRGLSYYYLGNYQQAINDVKTAANLGSKKAQAYLNSKGISW